MKNFTQQIKTALLFSVLVFLAITANAQNNYFIKMDGTKVNIHGEELYDDGKTIQYKNESNKNKIESIKNIKILILGGSILINIPINPKRDFRSLPYIVAFNDKYVLTGKLYTHEVYLNVLDREFNFVNTDVIKLSNTTTKNVLEKNKQIYKEYALKYFKDCTSLNEAIYKNIEKGTTFYDGINYYNCNNAPDLFTNKTVKSSEVNQDIVKEVEKIDFYINTKGEKIEFTKYFTLHKLDTKFSYEDKSKTSNFGVTSTINSTDVKYISYDGKVYTPMEYQEKQQLMEIVAFNDNYTLACAYKYNWMGMKSLGESISSFLVYDRKTNAILNEVKVAETIKPVLEKYFGSCKVNLNSLIEDNKKNHRGMSFGFSYINCGNAKELIEGIKFE
jgi:hypothetical protein